MRNKDFIAHPDRVAHGENSHGFRAVTAAENVTQNPMPRQSPSFGENMNGERFAQFPAGADYTPDVRGTSRRLKKGGGR